MSCTAPSWVEELPAEITVCYANGMLIEMNASAELLFKDDGGGSLLGSEALACHPEPSRTKLVGMLAVQDCNVYLNTEKGENRFFSNHPGTKAASLPASSKFHLRYREKYHSLSRSKP